MNRWFRFYNDALRNPKVAGLSDRDFRTWVSLLAIANENEGRIPSKEALKHLLMMRLDHLLSVLDRLARIGLIDILEDGYEPHNWTKFQYKSDSSRERVTLHRKRRNADPVTAPEADYRLQTQKEEEVDRDGYRFGGETIKLSDGDFEKWQRMYSAIPDLAAELSSIDAWFQDKPDLQGKWFWRTQSMLAKRHQELRATATSNGYPPGHSGIPV